MDLNKMQITTKKEIMEIIQCVQPIIVGKNSEDVINALISVVTCILAEEIIHNKLNVKITIKDFLNSLEQGIIQQINIVNIKPNSKQ